MLVVGSIVIRVDDLDRLVEFWTQALDGPNVSLDRVRSELHIPPRIHLDLYAEDRAAEVTRLRSLGASEIPWSKRPADADYVIMADPEGNRFCVIDAADWFAQRRARQKVT